MFESFVERLTEANSGEIPFKDQINFLKKIKKIIVEWKIMGADLLFMSTYMAAITTSDITRPEIFSYTSKRREYAPAEYIAKSNKLVQDWHYSYAQSLKAVAEKVHNRMMQSMMNRYSNAIDSGVPDDDFLVTELGTIKSIYRNTFEQGCSLLQKWSDAYIAMLLSGSVVAIIIMISVAIYAPEGIESALGASYGIIMGISVFGVGLMYHAVPDDKKTHDLPGKCTKEQQTIRNLEKILVPFAAFTGILILISGLNAGIMFLSVGFLLMPLGVLGYIDDNKIMQRDEDFATFIRTLGSVMGGKGMTVKDALVEVDKKSLPYLRDLIDTVHYKLNLGLNDTLSWNKFIGECGSNFIYKYLNIFRDSIALGGDPDEIGKIVGDSLLEQTLLRRKRDMLVKGFTVLLVPMHAAMAAIFVFLFSLLLKMSQAVTEVMGHFQDTQAALSGSAGGVGAGALGGMGGGLGMFTDFPVDIMTDYVVNILLMITFANIVAGRVVAGGNRYMYYFFAFMFFLLTGIIYVVAPIIVDIVFNLPDIGGLM